MRYPLAARLLHTSTLVSPQYFSYAAPFICPSPYARPSIPASFVPRPLFNRCKFPFFLPPPPPRPSAHHIHFDFLTSSALSFSSHRQFRAVSPLYLPRTCSVLAPLQFRRVPRRSFVTTLLSSLRILIDATTCARVCPPSAELRRLFPLRSPHYLSGCIAFKSCLSVPRTEVARLSPPSLPLPPLYSPLFATLAACYITVARLCLAFPTSIHLSNCASLAFPYLSYVSSHSTPAVPLRSADCAMPVSLRPFLLIFRSPCVVRPPPRHSMSSCVKLSEFFQSRSTLRPGIGYTFSSGV